MYRSKKDNINSVLISFFKFLFINNFIENTKLLIWKKGPDPNNVWESSPSFFYVILTISSDHSSGLMADA